MTALRYSVLSSLVLTNPAGNANCNSRSMRAAVAFGARRRKAPCDDNVRFLKTAVLMRSFELSYLFGAGAAACLRQDAFAAKRLPIQGSAVSRKRTLIEAPAGSQLLRFGHQQLFSASDDRLDNVTVFLSFRKILC